MKARIKFLSLKNLIFLVTSTGKMMNEPLIHETYVSFFFISILIANKPIYSSYRYVDVTRLTLTYRSHDCIFQCNNCLFLRIISINLTRNLRTKSQMHGIGDVLWDRKKNLSFTLFLFLSIEFRVNATNDDHDFAKRPFVKDYFGFWRIFHKYFH